MTEAGEFRYAMDSTDPVLDDLDPLAAPPCPTLECRMLVNLQVARSLEYTDQATGRKVTSHHIMVDFLRSLSPELESSWRDHVNLSTTNKCVSTGAWDVAGLSIWLEYLYGRTVPPSGIPKGYSWDGHQAVLAGAVQHILEYGDAPLKARWDNFLEAQDAALGRKPRSQRTDVLKGFLRLHGVTYASHRMLEYYAPAQLATHDCPPSMYSAVSSADSRSDASSQGDRLSEQQEDGDNDTELDRQLRDKLAVSDDHEDGVPHAQPSSSGKNEAPGGRSTDSAGHAEGILGDRGDDQHDDEVASKASTTPAPAAPRDDSAHSPAGEEADEREPSNSRDWDPNTPASEWSPVTTQAGPGDADQAPAPAAPTTPHFRERNGPPHSPWQPVAREDRDQRVASSVRSRPRETARDDAWHSNSGWWSNHSWREGSRAPRDADRASRIGDVPWHRERSQHNDIVFQDSWYTEEGFPPLYPNTADVSGPPQLYRKPRGQIVWKKKINL